MLTKTALTGKWVLAAVLLAAATVPAAVEAQIVYGQPWSSSLSFNYSTWTVEGDGVDESISQRAFILSGFAPVGEDMEARFHISTAYNGLERGTLEDDISGLGDLRVQLARSFMKDRMLLSAGVNLPTGKKELDPGGGRRIIESLSRDYLSLPLRRYGEGFGFNLLAGGAAELGRFKCGLSATYDFLGEYRPYEDAGDYDPGDAVSLSATAATEAGRISYTGDASFSYFATDRLDGDDIYRQAPQLSTRIMIARPGDTYRASLGANLVIRGRNRRYSVNAGTVESQLKKYGDEFSLFARLGRSLGGTWQVGGMIGTRQILESEEELGRSSLINLGVDLGREIAGSAGLKMSLLYHTGSAAGGDLDLTGLQVSAGIDVAY